MRLDWLRPVLERKGPFVTACLDASRDDPAGAHEVELRWQGHAEKLATLGAPQEALRAAGEAAVRPTGRAGKLGRLVVATGDGLALDVVLPVPPVREEAVFAPIPDLLPAVRASGGVVFAVVDLDRKGADVEVVGVLGEPVETEQVEGDHDLLHKVPGGGWSQRRYQARVEDSWDHNAHTVARALNALERQHRPSIIVVRGDDKAAAALGEHISPQVRERVVRVHGGGRGAGADDSTGRGEVAQVLAAHADRSRAAVVDRFREAEGRQDVAVQGLDAVLDTLRRGQVEELLLRDDPTSPLQLWVGSAPGAVAQRRSEIEAMGEQHPEKVRAGAALVWAALSTDAGITLVADDAPIAGGVGALLRWSDRSTPHDAVPSMPGHGRKP
jgi:Bacterial archaeo-eukaryotic release factor family 2